MSNTVKDILNYIEFLRESGFMVMLSCFNPILDKFLPDLIKYEPHLPTICSYLKSSPETREKCIRNKQKLNDLSPRETYYSCCWAGVEEYLIPIVYRDISICCINLSGFRGVLRKSEILFQKLINKLGKEFIDRYTELSENPPDINMVEKITNPLKYMLYALYDECVVSKDAPANLYIDTLKYINDHYMEKLSIESIASELNYSASYLRYVFSKHSRKTVTEYLNSTRLSHAANSLKYTNNSITQIAFDCGFCDSNYFSTAFKKRHGISPTKYRKLYKNT